MLSASGREQCRFAYVYSYATVVPWIRQIFMPTLGTQDWRLSVARWRPTRLVGDRALRLWIRWVGYW
jgi:hypothetical protein